MNGFYLVIVFIILFSKSVGHKLLVTNARVDSDIDTMVAKVMSCYGIVGMNLAVVHSKNILKTSSYGFRSNDRVLPVDSRTKFGLASLSKAFTTTLLAKLLDQSNGKWSWRTRVVDVFGSEFRFNSSLLTREATLADLASHRLGLAKHNRLRLQQHLSRETLVKKIQFLKIVDGFRESFIYSNLAYGLLSRATEIIGGDTWENLMKQHIYSPLGMDGASFTHEVESSNKNIATSYVVRDKRLLPVPLQFHRFWGGLGGSGSIMLDVEDAAHWLLFHVNGGRDARNRTIVSSAALRETYEPRVVAITRANSLFSKPPLPVNYDNSLYAMGWRVGSYRGYRQIMHTGTSFGFTSMLTYLPDLNLAVFTNLNTVDPGYVARKLLHTYVIDKLMHFNSLINASTACSFPEPWARKRPATKTRFTTTNTKVALKHPPSTYTGVYGNMAYGNISVANSGQNISLHYGPYARWNLYPNADDKDSFYGILPEELKFFRLELSNVVFETLIAGAYDQIRIDDLQINNPPIFTRGLKLEFGKVTDPYTMCDLQSHSCSWTLGFNGIICFITVKLLLV